MPPLPSVDGQTVVKVLEKVGFAVSRVKGSHHVLRHPDGRGTTVPVHGGRPVAKGTLRAVLREIDMSVEEFERLRR